MPDNESPPDPLLGRKPGEVHERAARLAAEGWLREAIALYRELQAANAQDLRAIGALRDLYKRLGKAPELAAQWLLLADYRAAEGRLDQAQRAIARALEVHSGPEVLEGAGRRYCALGAIGLRSGGGPSPGSTRRSLPRPGGPPPRAARTRRRSPA